ncbi:MAG: MBL fold metallo-hydrolase, partial [Bryobacteraceae bacterium]
MKRLSFAAFFAILAAGAFLREAASQPNLVTQLAPGVYHRAMEREKRIIANAGWIVFRDYVLVIDANFPWGARATLNDIRKTTSKPVKFVFDTHYHGDHAWGNSVFVDAGATIVCSEECAEESKRKNTPSWAANSETGEFSLKGVRLEHPQLAFHNKMVFDDGEHRVELIRMGPGHTLGDSVAWLPKERILFTGDLCVNFPGNNVADVDADPDNWLRALDALAQKDITRLIPGHGGQGTR